LIGRKTGAEKVIRKAIALLTRRTINAVEVSIRQQETMTNDAENQETSDLAYCDACGAKQRGRDKFCRRCGASQRLAIASSTGDVNWSSPDTRPLLGISYYDSFSGALVKLVTEVVSVRASSLSSSLPGNRWTMWLVAALVAVPLWLILVLLSALDAYVAVRAIARRA
jgi:hypothetical protein